MHLRDWRTSAFREKMAATREAPPKRRRVAGAEDLPGVLILGPTVGRGAYGDVVKGFYCKKDKVVTQYDGLPLDPDEKYAVKYQNRRETLHEVAVLKTLQASKYVMKLYGTAEAPVPSKHTLLMVVERLDTTLKQRLAESVQSRRYNFVRLALQLFEALAFLESKQVAHLDLHAGNIMFRDSDESDPVLIDFGFAENTKGGKITPFEGYELKSWRYYHPLEQRELVRGVGRYGRCTTKFDLYSVAVNLVNLCYDAKQNFGVTATQDFADAFTQATLKTNDLDFSFKTLDARLASNDDFHPGYEVEVLDMPENAMYSCYRFNGTYPQLFLHMPTELGRLLALCLGGEILRPSASRAVEIIKRHFPSSSSALHNVFNLCAPLRF